METQKSDQYLGKAECNEVANSACREANPGCLYYLTLYVPCWDCMATVSLYILAIRIIYGFV